MIALACAWALALASDDGLPPPAAPAAPARAEVEAAIDRGIAFLLEAQYPNGAFGGPRNQMMISAFANPATYHCWRVGTTGLAIETLLRCAKNGPDAAAAIERGLDYLTANALLLRPAEWDVDNNWGLIYGLTALCAALSDPRFAGHEKAASWREAAQNMVTGLERYQGARGGWGYYADPDAGWRPDWATSFTTAAALLALLDAEALGLEVTATRRASATRAIQRSRLPSGAYGYDVAAVPRHLSSESIDQVKGSLGRIQICNHALLRAGAELEEGAVEEGVALFFRHRKFLEVARGKPIPHEAYYANAAYFHLFGHYYVTFTLERLAPAARRPYLPELQRALLACQSADGSFWDFWIADSAKPYGTSFAVMALHRSLELGDAEAGD
jgi:hypothetical protein